MDRYIDTVMIGSDRVDERARLIARLCDTVGPLVGELGPRTPDHIRGALLATMRRGHQRPLDVVAEVLDHLSETIGVEVVWQLPGATPGEALALGLCDGHGLTDFAVGATLGVDRDEVAAARDTARLEVGLPPAPPACTLRHADVGCADTCVACVLVRADAMTAQARVLTHLGLPCGVVMDRVITRIQQWQSDVLRPPLPDDPSGPSPWTAIAGVTA